MTAVDWSRPIEAVHPGGMVVPVKATNGPYGRGWYNIEPAVGDDHFSFNADGSHGNADWRIRNVQPTTPELDPALWDRMVALARAFARTDIEVDEYVALKNEARAIVANLPKPADPDEREAEALIAARQWGENDTYDYQAIKLVAMDALRRGRELATPEVSHVG